MKTLLVGSHFHPPAKQVLQFLPFGTEVELRPEPENPYDPEAIQVWVEPEAVPAEMRGDLALALEGTGTDLDEFLSAPSWCLGHVARTGGKPLQTEPGLVGTREFAGHRWGTLEFRGDGKVLIEAEQSHD